MSPWQAKVAGGEMWWAKPGNAKRSSRMNERMKMVAVILVVVGIAAGILWLSQDNGGAGIPFADVVQPLLTARTVTYKATTKLHGYPDRKAEVMFMEPGHTRYTTGEIVIISNSQQGEAVYLDPKEKTATVGEMENTEKSDYLERQVMLFFNTREYIRNALETEYKTVKPLGKRTIDGRTAVGHKISEHLRDVTVWVDVETQLPIRVETSVMLWNGITSTKIMDHFAFDVDLDEALFSLEIPKDYTIEKGILKVDVARPAEKDIVEMFRVWTEATSGEFPSALEIDAMEEFHRAQSNRIVQRVQASKPVDAWPMVHESSAVVRGFVFVRALRASSNWSYAGEGVKLGEADKAVFWYRPEGSQAYRVIYGDLSIKEMAEKGLPR